ncbi:MAG: sigma-54-dependent Fis family transcriptional regulator [Candidatus Omnitrophica bacterium]|nr:sigma-54-dependent Fis family transcriptional regulator [Candidatus Omnitrophota bacterium]
MNLHASILVVDDEKNTREGMKQYLESGDYDVMTAADGREGWEIFLKESPDLVLADIRMPSLGGVELLEKIKNQNPKIPVILMTAYGSVEDAVKAIKKGAFYYLTKPVHMEELDYLVKKALSSRQLEEENQELRQALFQEKFERGDILGNSQKVRELLETVDKIAKSNAAVLIEGESGTGKELIAHRIHALSERSGRPFVAVHCAALTETLLPSELFGHERGAFTGASERKIGRFERANQGTLFLDEVGEISQETQVKLLRVLQEGEFERVGGVKTLKVDVRLICATNKNLIQEVKAGRFREDLYYRINVIYLKVPPLRERKEDISILVDSFIPSLSQANHKKIVGIDTQALHALIQYDWPGNVRELKNIIERMVVLSTDSKLHLPNVPEDIRQGSSGASPNFAVSSPLFSSPPSSLNEMEKEMIKNTLFQVKGNKSRAAKKLGISRRTLYRKLTEYNL